MADFTPAVQGVTNFVTSPDFVPSILIRNATEQQIIDCMESCRLGTRVYNVYIQTDNATEDWIMRVEGIVDDIIDAQNTDLIQYFNK